MTLKPHRSYQGECCSTSIYDEGIAIIPVQKGTETVCAMIDDVTLRTKKINILGASNACPNQMLIVKKPQWLL